MKKKMLFILLGTAAMATMLWGCGTESTENTADTEQAAESESTDIVSDDAEDTTDVAEDQVYESEDGWKVTYNTGLFYLNDQLGDGEIGFNYIGECAGTDIVTISYVEGEMPDEALYEKIQGYDESQVDIQRGESYFGADSYWSHYRIISSNTDPEEGDSIQDQFTAIEHNGGSIVIEVLTHTETDEERAMEISDYISGLLATFELVDQEPQTEYAYMVGGYICDHENENGEITAERESIVLFDDHTCEVTLSEDSDETGTWTGTELVLNDGNTYEFTVEGYSLYLNENGDWVEFTKLDDEYAEYTEEDMSEEDVSEEGDLISTDFTDVAGIYCTEDGDTFTITEDGSVQINILRLTYMEGTATGEYKGIVTITAEDANGNDMGLEFIVETGELIVTDSTWDYLENGTTFTFTK